MKDAVMEIDSIVFSEEKDKAQFTAKPLVTEKIYKKLEKLMKIAVQSHACVRGVKEVTKALRKKHKGSILASSSSRVCFRICLIAGDCTPIDVIAHLPVYCEDRNVPYAFVPTRRVSFRSQRGVGMEISCWVLRFKV